MAGVPGALRHFSPPRGSRSFLSRRWTILDAVLPPILRDLCNDEKRVHEGVGFDARSGMNDEAGWLEDEQVVILEEN
jgi:hypothetical protein